MALDYTSARLGSSLIRWIGGASPDLVGPSPPRRGSSSPGAATAAIGQVSARGDTLPATILGHVIDSVGTAVAGAEVVLTRVSDSVVLGSTTSDAKGRSAAAPAGLGQHPALAQIGGFGQGAVTRPPPERRSIASPNHSGKVPRRCRSPPPPWPTVTRCQPLTWSCEIGYFASLPWFSVRVTPRHYMAVRAGFQRLPA